MRINTFELFSSSILIHLVMPSSASQPKDVTGIANCFNQFYFSREGDKSDENQADENLKEFNKKLLDSLLKKGLEMKLDDPILVNKKIIDYWSKFVNNEDFFPGKKYLLPEIVFKLIIDTMFFSNVGDIASFTDEDKDEVAKKLGFTENSEVENIRDNVKTLIGYYRDCAICSGNEWFVVSGFKTSKAKEQNERFLFISNLIANIDAGFKALYDAAKKASSSNTDQDFQESHERVRDHLKNVHFKFVDVSTSLLSAFKGLLILRMSGTPSADAEKETIKKAHSDCDNDGTFKLVIESIGSVKDNSKFMKDYLEKLDNKLTETSIFLNFQGSFLPEKRLEKYKKVMHTDSNGFKKLYSDAKKAGQTKDIREELAKKVKGDINYSIAPLMEYKNARNMCFRKGAYVYLAELYLMAYEVPLTAKNEQLHKRLRATINLLTHILVMFGNTYNFARGEECMIPILELFSTMNSVSNNTLLRSDLKSIIDRNQSNTLSKNVDVNESGNILKIFNESLKNQAAIQEPTKNNTVFSSFLKSIIDGNKRKHPSNNVDVSESGNILKIFNESLKNQAAIQEPTKNNTVFSPFLKSIIDGNQNKPLPNPDNNSKVVIGDQNEILSKLDDFRDPKNHSEKFLNPDFRESKKCATFVLQLADLLMLSMPVCPQIHFETAKLQPTKSTVLSLTATPTETPPTAHLTATPTETPPKAHLTVISTETPPKAHLTAISTETPPKAHLTAISTETPPKAHLTAISTETPPKAHLTAISTETPPKAHLTAISTETPPTAHLTAISTETPPTAHLTAISTETPPTAHLTAIPANTEQAKKVLGKLDSFIQIIKSGINPPDFKFLKLVFQKNKGNEKDNGFSKLLEEIFESESSIIGKEKTISYFLVLFALFLSVSIVILIQIYLILKNRNKRMGVPFNRLIR
ncbi:hypothetical protein GINT2_000650 [Glugoides intestinalis]